MPKITPCQPKKYYRIRCEYCDYVVQGYDDKCPHCKNIIKNEYYLGEYKRIEFQKKRDQIEYFRKLKIQEINERISKNS